MEHSGFFNGDQEYGQEEFNRYFENIYENGVSLDENSNLTLSVSLDAEKIKINTGFAIVKGFYLFNDNTKIINSIRNPNYDKVDRVVIRLNLTSKTVTLEYKQGTPGSKPVAPSLQRDNSIWELSLAQIYVPKQGDLSVTDERFRKDLCGAIRPRNLTEYKDMILQFQAQFDAWFNSQQSKGWRNVYIQPTQPEGSVKGSIWIETVEPIET